MARGRPSTRKALSMVMVARFAKKLEGERQREGDTERKTGKDEERANRGVQHDDIRESEIEMGREKERGREDERERRGRDSDGGRCIHA